MTHYSNDIKVSVICITYNQVDYIRDAIDSFLMQKTNFDFEILIHDDASTDGTAEIVKEYADRYPDKIKAVLQTENQYSKGVKVSDTFLVPLMRGHYVAFCEGDDFWCDPNKLQIQYDYMESHPDCAMYIHGGWNVSPDLKTIFNSHTLTDKPCKFGVEDAIRGLGIKTLTNSFFYRAKYRYNLPEFMKIAPTGDYGRVIVAALGGYIYYDPKKMSAHRCLAKNSFTVTYNKNPSKWYTYLDRQIAMLDCLDECTDHIYTALIAEEKTRQRFDIYLKVKDKVALGQEPYRSLMKKLPLKTKIKRNCPFLFNLLRKMTQLFRKATQSSLPYQAILTYRTQEEQHEN